MKKVQVSILSLLLAIFLTACNSEDGNETVPEEDDAVTEEENNGDTEENEDVDSTSGTSDTDTGDSNNESSESSDGEVLSLGETGVIESTLGDYEITFESFQFLDELDGNTSSAGVYVVLEAKVENTGEDTLEGNDLYSASLFTEEDTRAENSFNNAADLMEGPIEPGETMEGQFVFSIEESNEYQLIYNFGFGAFATEVTWEFTADEASNE